MDSLGFSSFRQLIDVWEDAAPAMDMRSRLNRIIDGQDLSLFFQKGDDIFGAPEDSRVVFARLKNPDPEAPSGWADMAQFFAVNLAKPGEEGQATFGMKDIPEIKVIDQDKAVEEIINRKK